MADQQRARALFGLALNATAVVGWAALLLLFRIHPPEPRHPGLVVVVALMRCLVSLYLRHSATPWQPRAAVSEPSMNEPSRHLPAHRPSRGSRAPPTPQPTRDAGRAGRAVTARTLRAVEVRCAGDRERRAAAAVCARPASGASPAGRTRLLLGEVSRGRGATASRCRVGGALLLGEAAGYLLERRMRLAFLERAAAGQLLTPAAPPPLEPWTCAPMRETHRRRARERTRHSTAALLPVPAGSSSSTGTWRRSTRPRPSALPVCRS